MNIKFNKNSRFLSLILSICMIYMVIPLSVSASGFTDISNHWAQTRIESWLNEDLIKGYSDGSFKPDKDITRAEFINMVNKAFAYKSTTPISYSDVRAGAWYYNSIEIALDAGYLNGYPDGTIKPENSITREEVATILMNINKLKGNENAANIFTDVSNFTWSKGAIGAIYEEGIMQGFPDGSFRNQNFIKRGEALVALDKNLEYITDKIPLASPKTTNTTPAPEPELANKANSSRGTSGGGSSGGSSSGASGGSSNSDQEIEIVADTIPPFITLLGNVTEKINIGNAYTDPGARASDNKDGDITNNIVVTITNNIDSETTFNNTKAAIYTYHYNVRDAANNVAQEVTRTVIVSAVETIQEQVAPVGLEGIAPKSFGGSDGYIIGTSDEMEYRLTSVQTWTEVTGTEIQNLESGWYDVRYKAKAGYNEGIAATIGVEPGPKEDQGAPAGLEGVATTTSGAIDGKITGTSDEMEYRLLPDGTWKPIIGTEITGLEAGFYDVRYSAKEGFNEGATVAITVAEAPNQSQGAPEGFVAVAPTTYGGSDGYIRGTTSEMEYRLLTDDTWISATESEITGLKAGWYDIRYAAKDGYDPSIAATIGLPEGPTEDQAAPEGLVGIAPTSFGGNDGYISGTTSEMEYLYENTWIEVTGTEIQNLESGWYDVRYKAKPGFNERIAATIVVAPGPKENQATPEGLVAVAPTSFGGTDGKISGTTSEMEYRILTNETWMPVTGTEITGLSSGFYYVRFAEKAGYNPGAYVEILLKEALATLNALAIDGIPVKEFSADIFIYNVELPAGTILVPTVTATAADSNAPVAITPALELPGQTSILVTAQDGINKQTYTINFTLANRVPLGLKAVAPTILGGSDGKIIGTTSAMEYRTLTNETWIPVTGTEIIGLTAGTYLVRFAAQVGYSVGSPANVLVPNPGTGKLIFTFDDGWKDTLTLGKPILDTAGFKATVYVNRDVTQAAEYGWSDYHIENVMDYNDLHVLYDHGWDISNHSTNHLDYKRTTDGSLLVGLDNNPLEWQTPEAYGIAHPEIEEEQVYTKWLETLVSIGSDASTATIERLREVYEDNQYWLLNNGPDKLGKLVNGVWIPGQNLNMPLSARHIAYPSGLFSDQLVTMIEDIGAETGRATTENDTSNNILGYPDFFRLPVQYVETNIENGIDVNVDKVKETIDYAVTNGSTVILMLHRVGPAGDLFVEEASLQAIVDYAKSFTEAGRLDVMTISQWYNMIK